MTQEERQLLLKDISARLPYNVVVRCTDGDTDYKCFLTTGILDEIQNGYEYYDYKPYLRPLSSMTLEEKIELKAITNGAIQTIGLEDIVVTTDKGFDYLNAHHIDYRGLIPMGLALEAPEDMYEIQD